MSNAERNPLLDGFFHRLEKDPNEIALRGGNGKTCTFHELNTDSETCLASFRQQGVHKGDRVAILGLPNRELFAVTIALLRLGCTLVLADPGMGADVFRSRMAAAQPSWTYLGSPLKLLTRHPLLRWFLARRGVYIPHPKDLPTAKVLNIPKPRRVDTTLPATNRSLLLPFDAGHEQAIVFTSGTTAQPKGVVHTIGSLEHSLHIINETCNFTSSSLIFTSLPYFMLIGIASGVSITLPPLKFSASGWYRAIIDSQPTHIFAAPSEIDQAARELQMRHQHFPDSLVQIMLGSAPVTRPVLELVEGLISAKTLLRGVYGLTEMIPVAFVNGREKLRRAIDGDWLGELQPSIQAKIGPDGQLLLASPHMSPRYLDQPDTAWVDTGDIVMIHGRELILKGRAKDMIIRGNYNIYPRLYEPTIERIPGVAACAMVGVWDNEINDERVVLVVEALPGQEGTILQTVRAYIKKPEFTIDEAALPDAFLSLKIPRSGRQLKVDKKRLVSMITTSS